MERVLGEKPSQGLADTLHADWVGFVKTGQMPWTPAEPDTLTRARRYENEGSFEAEQAYRFEVGLAVTERHEH
ncbi:hypothetical protein [Kineosporia sp. NBRC 101731]|uniref:hypothetical protein n=1 Tax=Kineosporia sp. NBRC 101731 TaxID=3032199 RepID=UPI002553C11E|nr:hypothetical protein [Kineosporia sp. NBRC 101731]